MSLLRSSLLLLLLSQPLLYSQESARYIDDAKFATAFDAALQMAGSEGRGTPGSILKKQLRRGPCLLSPGNAGKKSLSPQTIHRSAADAVFAISSVRPGNDAGTWESGPPATAWAVTSDGCLVTNWHVFEEMKGEERFGVMSRTGIFFPVMEILGADEAADIAVIRIEASGLKPLALSEDEPEGSRIFVLSHPDNQFYTFTQGHVSRYTLQHQHEKDAGVKYMTITADFARGSSGGPVINNKGAVVGMVCSTQTTYYGQKGKDPDDDVQMVVKYCVPGESIRKFLTTGKPLEKPADPAPPVPQPTPAETPPAAEPAPEAPPAAGAPSAVPR